MKVFPVNTVLGAADVNEYLVNTKFAVKPNATTITSQAVPAPDPDLQLQVDSNKTYWIELCAPFNTAAAAGFKYNFSAPAGSILTGYAQILDPSLQATSIYTYDPAAANLVGQNITFTTGGSVGDYLVAVRGTLVTAGTAGHFVFQWSQNTANGGQTRDRGGSCMRTRRGPCPNRRTTTRTPSARHPALRS